MACFRKSKLTSRHLDGVKAVHALDKEHSVSGGRCGTDGLSQLAGTQQALLALCCEHEKTAAASPEIDFSISHQRGCPGFPVDVVGPAGFARFHVHTMEFVSTVRDK